MSKRRVQADCYGLSAVFAWLGRACGYDAYFRAGGVPSVSQGVAAHGWTEIRYNGTTYVCDPSYGRINKERNWYMNTYANAPTAYVR